MSILKYNHISKTVECTKRFHFYIILFSFVFLTVDWTLNLSLSMDFRMDIFFHLMVNWFLFYIIIFPSLLLLEVEKTNINKSKEIHIFLVKRIYSYDFYFIRNCFELQAMYNNRRLVLEHYLKF